MLFAIANSNELLFLAKNYIKTNKLDKNSQEFKMVAKTFQGLEDVLAEELEVIGASNIEKANRAVTFTGDQAMMYRANYQLRTAISILKPIAEFNAKNEDDLYKEVGKISWSKYMGLEETFSVSSVTFSKTFTHSQYISLKVKDAIVDQFRRRQGKRPNVNTIAPDLKIHIHIAENHCTLLLDSSGESLFKRGYRVQTVKAPINEVLAAAMIKLSGWDMKSDFFDPMCGSGTILIEAAMMAYNIAPGTFRSKFGFETWKDFDADIFEEISEEIFNEVKFEHSITGSDISPVSIKMTETNLKQAFLNKKVKVKPQNFFDGRPEKQDTYIITNPPYGERLQPDDLKLFYQKIGDKLKQDYSGNTVWIIGSNADLMKFIGLKPDKKIPLYNGPLECTYRKFSLYEGSKKDSTEDLTEE